MTSREWELIRLTLIYAIANLDDLCDAFQCDDDEDQVAGKIDFNGEIIDAPTEKELDDLMQSI
jgi:hypothetical protein